ncbi:MAG: AAA family ATPase [Candidatus Sumerlaeia bacterium]|nr:AAA family ATPase [Candidatus Sumerlaeia bacterium]
MLESVVIQGTSLKLAQPDELTVEWIGNQGVQEQLMASWLTLGPKDLPLTPRIIGYPGVGKTTLAYHVAKSLGKPVYMMQCTMDTRPEDLLVTPVLGENGGISYHASPLVTAMIKGGVCILDEGNRMSEKSWASLAPLLDTRRYVESILAGVKIKASPEFRLCVTMNEDASTYEIPEYIQSRLKPQIEVPFPNREEEMQILSWNVPLAGEQLVQYVADFLQKAHHVNYPFSSRDGVHILRYVLKMGHLKQIAPEGLLAEGIEAVLGDDGREFLDGGVPSDRMRGAYRDLESEEDELPEDDESEF